MQLETWQLGSPGTRLNAFWLRRMAGDSPRASRIRGSPACRDRRARRPAPCSDNEISISKRNHLREHPRKEDCTLVRVPQSYCN